MLVESFDIGATMIGTYISLFFIAMFSMAYLDHPQRLVAATLIMVVMSLMTIKFMRDANTRGAALARIAAQKWGLSHTDEWDCIYGPSGVKIVASTPKGTVTIRLTLREFGDGSFELVHKNMRATQAYVRGQIQSAILRA